MSTVLRYEDRTMAALAALMRVATLAGIAGFALSLADVIDRSTHATWLLVATVFCFFVAFFYRSAVPVTVSVDGARITKEQGLGMGWDLAWSDVSQVATVPLDPPRIAVTSDLLRARRPISERAIRKAALPQKSRSVPATPEMVTAVTAVRGPLDEVPLD